MDELELKDFQNHLKQLNDVMTDRDTLRGLSSLAAVQRDLGKNTLTPTKIDEDSVYSTKSNRLGIVNGMKVSIEKSDGQAFDPLLNGIRRSTINVRLINSIKDLVQPLADEMRILHLENMAHDIQMHRENVLYYRSIVTAIHSLGRSNKQTFLESALLSYRAFIRNPFWTTLNLTLSTLSGVVKTAFSVSKGLLLGFRRRMTDTDRIVKAINEQTEFMRTGQIDRSMGFFTRLFRTGILGTAGAGIASVAGFGRGRAQERENIQSRGGQQNDIRSRVASWLFGGSIVQRGRESGQLGREDQNIKLLEEIRDIFFDWNGKGVDVNIKDSGRIYDGEFEIVNSMMANGESLINIASQGKAMQTFMEKSKEDTIEFREAQLVALEDIADATDDSHKVLKKIRGGQIFGMFQRAVNGLLSFGGTIGSALIGAVTGTVSTVIGLMGGTIISAVKKIFLGGIFSNGIKSALGITTMAGGLALPVAITAIGAWGAFVLTEKLNEWFGTTDEQIQSERNARLNPAAGLGQVSQHGNVGRQLAGGMITPGQAFGDLGNLSIASSAGLSAVAQREGYRSNAYQDQAGVWTIGYGTTQINGRPVQKGDTITEEQAMNLMKEDYSSRASRVMSLVKVPLNQNQLDALTSLSYNIGMGAFAKSTLLKKLNAGDYTGAAGEFSKWNKAGGRVNEGLINRRREEAQQFLSGDSSGVMSGSGLTSTAIDASLDLNQRIERSSHMQTRQQRHRRSMEDKINNISGEPVVPKAEAQRRNIDTSNVSSNQTQSQTQQSSDIDKSGTNAIVQKLSEILDALTSNEQLGGYDFGTSVNIYGR